MESVPAQDSADPAESNNVAVVGKKRPAAEVEGDAGAKRARNGVGSESEMRRIAEIVLFLSSMGTMRGGRDPTALEKAMMAEARAKMVSICEGLAPKDIMPREVFAGVIEDLGLNRFKEQQRLGIRPSKLSIVGMMEISQKRMGEEAKSFASQAVVDSTPRVQSGEATAPSPFPSDKANHMLTSAGSSQHSSPKAHVSPATSTIFTFQTPGSLVSAPSISTVLPNSNLGRDSLATAKVERQHLRSDGRVNGPSQASQAPAGFVVKTTSAFQPQTIPSNNISFKIKPSDHMPVKTEGNANLQVSHIKSQAEPGMHFVHATTLMSHHLEICKIVQKVLHPKPADRPFWTPPSKDYMSKSVTCQMCQSLSNQVDNMLVCDACEKAFHMKCLQVSNQKFVSRGEWYCPRCITINVGKPFPPKYGRVTRNMIASKISSNSANQQIRVTDTKSDEKITPPGGIVAESTEEKDIQRNKSAQHIVKPDCEDQVKTDCASGEIKCNVKQNDQDVAAGIGTQLQNSATSLEEKHNVEWIGSVHVVDNKKFYRSCLISGVVYKLQDFALVRFSNGKIIPSKLQIMWEDSQTGSRWVAVNRCYFPNDLPATAGRPSAPEENEVYESNDESTLMVEFIKGPCTVLPTKIFGEATKNDDENNGDRPIFSCRWFYDKIKGVFRPIPR